MLSSCWPTVLVSCWLRPKPNGYKIEIEKWFDSCTWDPPAWVCPDLTAVKDFVRFYVATSQPQIGEKPTINPINTVIEWFFAGFTRVTVRRGERRSMQCKSTRPPMSEARRATEG